MTVKGLKKQLMAAIAMVLVSVIALGSSTYAWFAMNTQVKATGLKVSVKSNDTFLLINTDTNNTVAKVQSAQKTTIPVVTIDAEEAEVFPSKPKAASEVGTGKRFEDGTAVSNATTAAVVGNWYTANNDNPASANDSVKNITSLTTFDDYVIKRTVYLTLAVGSEDAWHLTVTPTFTNSGSASSIDAAKVLVATGDNFAILNKDSGATSLYATTDQVLDDETLITVDIYVYYDGEESVVNTNNKANLSEASIDLAFDVTIK